MSTGERSFSFLIPTPIKKVATGVATPMKTGGSLGSNPTGPTNSFQSLPDQFTFSASLAAEEGASGNPTDRERDHLVRARYRGSQAS
jgi:hypothetical protein